MFPIKFQNIVRCSSGYSMKTHVIHIIYILILPYILFVNSCPSIIWFYTTMKDKKFELNYPVLSKEFTNASTNIYKMVES